MLYVALLAGFLVGCSGDHTEGKTEAEVREVTETPAPTPATTSGKMVNADNTNSKLEWVGAKVTNSHPGGFNKFTVEGTIEGNRMIGVKTEIDLASLYSDSEKLTGHLKDEDFFNVSAFTTATFTSTEIKSGGADGATHTVVGVLDLHGVQKELSFPATIDVSPAGATLDAEFSINRNDWGIVYPGKPDDLIKEKVLIKLDINFS
ncbi:MAG: YceI family protein [Myxococcota bacterium]